MWVMEKVWIAVKRGGEKRRERQVSRNASVWMWTRHEKYKDNQVRSSDGTTRREGGKGTAGAHSY